MSIKEFVSGYRFASVNYDDAINKQESVDYLYIMSDNFYDFTDFDRGIKEFLSYNNLTSSYEPIFGE